MSLSTGPACLPACLPMEGRCDYSIGQEQRTTAEMLLPTFEMEGREGRMRQAGRQDDIVGEDIFRRNSPSPHDDITRVRTLIPLVT